MGGSASPLAADVGISCAKNWITVFATSSALSSSDTSLDGTVATKMKWFLKLELIEFWHNTNWISERRGYCMRIHKILNEGCTQYRRDYENWFPKTDFIRSIWYPYNPYNVLCIVYPKKIGNQILYFWKWFIMASVGHPWLLVQVCTRIWKIWIHARGNLPLG